MWATLKKEGLNYNDFTLFPVFDLHYSVQPLRKRNPQLRSVRVCFEPRFHSYILRPFFNSTAPASSILQILMQLQIQILHVDRLGDMVIHAAGKAAADVLSEHVRCHRDDGYCIGS